MFSIRTLWILIAVELVLLLIGVHEWQLLPDGKAHASVLNVGQGDSILLVSPSGKQILIDGGPDLSALAAVGQRMPWTDRTIELLVLTHPDLDHVAAFPEILRRYRVNQILLTGVQKKSNNGAYREFQTLIREKHIPVIQANPAQDIDMGDGLILDVAWPYPTWNGQVIDDVNDTSVTIRAIHGDRSMLLTGDIEHNAEQTMLRSGTPLRSTILKVPHHGSKTSSSTGFLLAVDPEQALISVSVPSKFGHPHAVVMERYQKLGIPTHITGKEGTLSVEF